MERDRDYVTFSDYEKDTTELAQQAANVANTLKDEIHDLRRTIWLLVNAAGGKITIQYNDLIDYDDQRAVLIKDSCPTRDSITFTARKKNRETKDVVKPPYGGAQAYRLRFPRPLRSE